jgi:hypothetical protein
MPALMILVAGPYRSGTNDDPVLIAKNVEAMTTASLALFRAGHLPVMGEWFALPLIEHAGSKVFGDAAFNEIFHPISRRLAAKCDACLRIGGSSVGADEMVAIARSQGKPGQARASQSTSHSTTCRSPERWTPRAPPSSSYWISPTRSRRSMPGLRAGKPA